MHSEPVSNQTREMDQPAEPNQPKPGNKHDQHGESDQPHEPGQNTHDRPDEMNQPFIPDQHNEPKNLPLKNQDKPENLNHSADQDHPAETKKYLPDDLGRYLGSSNDSDTSENEQTEKDKEVVPTKEDKSVCDIGRFLGGHEAQNASDLDDGKNLTNRKIKHQLLKKLYLKDLGKVFIIVIIIAAFVSALFAIVWLRKKETTQSSTKESFVIPTWIFYFKFAQLRTNCELFVLHMDPRPWYLDEDDDWIFSLHLPSPCLPNTSHQQQATENNHSTSHLRIPDSHQQLGQYNVSALQLQDNEETVSAENEYMRIGNAHDANNGTDENIVINTDSDLYQPAIYNRTGDVRVTEGAPTKNENTMEEHSQCAKLNDINEEQRSQSGDGLNVQMASIFQDCIPSEQHSGQNMVETSNPTTASQQKVRLSMLSDNIAWDNMSAHTEYISNDSIMNESPSVGPASSTGIGRRKDDNRSWSSQQIATDRIFLTDFQRELKSENSMFARNNQSTSNRQELYLSLLENQIPCDNMSAYTENSSNDYIMSENSGGDPVLSAEDDRVQTFNNGWSPTLPSPQRMAEAGFFFTGVDDVVRCFSCDVCIRQWLPEDKSKNSAKRSLERNTNQTQPLKNNRILRTNRTFKFDSSFVEDDLISEHERWSPGCCFIQQKMQFQSASSEPPKANGQETSNINKDDHVTRTTPFTSELVAFARSEGSNMQRLEDNRNHGNQFLAGEHHVNKRKNEHRPCSSGLSHSNVQHSHIAQPLYQESSERIRANKGFCKASTWDRGKLNTFEAGRPCRETCYHSHTDRFPTPCLNESNASETVTSHYGVKQNRMRDEMRNRNATYRKGLKMKMKFKNNKVIAAKPRPERPADKAHEIPENTTYSHGNISTNRLDDNSALDNIPRHRTPTSSDIDEVLESEDGLRVLGEGYAPADVARAILRLLEDGDNFHLSYARIIGVLRILRRRPRKTYRRKTP